MDANRKDWNQGHQKLRDVFSKGNLQKTIELFLAQHAMVHAREMSDSKLWSFEDEVLYGMTTPHLRCIPHGYEHSIVWTLLHIARIEDITMNMLVTGTHQLFNQEGWGQKLNISIAHSANSMDERSVAALSAQMDIDALLVYRKSVGRRTREIVKKLQPENFKERADPARLQNIMGEGALLPEAIGILEYWRKRTIAGLLLMPPTRHNFLHLNEALRIKQKLQKAK